MSRQAKDTREAKRLERLYGTKAQGTSHTTVLRLVRDRGLEGAIAQLEAWGMKPTEAKAGGRDG